MTDNSGQAIPTPDTPTVVPPDGMAGLAKDARQTLRAFIEAAEGGYVLCLCNSPAQRDRIVADLSRELAGLNIGFFRLKLQRSAPSIAGALRLALDASDFREYSGRVAKVAISVEDIDETIPTEYRDLSVRPPTLQGLNQQRDWLNKLGRPLLLWFPEWLMSRLREVAPDLWAGRAVVVEFETPGGLVEFQQAYLAARWSSVQSADEARRRIRIYQDVMKGKLDPARRAGLLVSIGNLHEGLGEWDTALREYEQALAAYLTLSDKQGEAAVLGNIGLVWRNKGEWDKALEYQEKALKLDRELGNRHGEAQDLGNIGSVWRNKGEWDKALKYLSDALAIQQQIGDKQGEASQLGNIGLVWQSKGEWDKALERHEKALKVFEELGAKQEQASVLGNIGVVWGLKGEWDKALEYYGKALKLAEELGDRQVQANNLGNIGSVWRLKSEWGKALQYQEKALKLDRELGNRQGEAQDLGNIGLVWQAKGEWDKALEYQEKALAIDKQIGRPEGVAMRLGNIGNTYVKMMMLTKDGGPKSGSEQQKRFFDSLHSLRMTPGPGAAQALVEEAVPKLAQALTMFLQLGAEDGPRQCLLGLNECLKVMGRDRFIAACEKAGMKKEEAEKLADALGKIEAKGK